jgi:glyoxylase I family protein
MIRGVHHVAVSTGDLDRLVAFYTGLFGFEVVMSTEWSDRPVIDEIVGLEGSSARQAMLRSGNAYLEIFEYRSPRGRRPGLNDRTAADHGYTHFCIDVTDIDAEYERLVAAGMTFHCAPPQLGAGMIRATYGRDPDGNIVELQEIIDPAIPFTLERTDLIGGTV